MCELSERIMTPVFNLPAPDTLDLLRRRRSGSAKAMGSPGPSKTQLAEILQSGARAPDHGKLFPWRFIIFEGKGRERFGDVLAEVLEAEGEETTAREQKKKPEKEQEKTAGAVCQNVLIAAHAMGFVGNWLTEWYAYHPKVKEKIGLKPGERIAGFIYIGTSTVDLEERPRPEMDKIVQYF